MRKCKWCKNYPCEHLGTDPKKCKEYKEKDIKHTERYNLKSFEYTLMGGRKWDSVYAYLTIIQRSTLKS